MAPPNNAALNAVDQPLLDEPVDPLGKIIYWRYFPYDQTRINWERAKEQAAANPYATRYALLSAEVDAQRKSFDAYLKAIQDERTLLEQKQEAERAKSNRRGGGGGGGGDLTTQQELAGWKNVRAQDELQLRETQDLRAEKKAAAEKIGVPDASILNPNLELANLVRDNRARGYSEDQIVASLASAKSDPANAIGKMSQSQDVSARAAAAVHLSNLLVQAGETPAAAKAYAAGTYNVTPGAVDQDKLDAAREYELGQAASLTLGTSDARLKETEILNRPRRSGTGKTKEQIAAEKAATLDPLEQAAVQRYVKALSDDYYANKSDIGPGRPFKDRAEALAGKAAYDKAAGLGLYTRAQAPYFSPAFLQKGRDLQVAQARQAEMETRFTEREARNPREVEQEQARLFLESQRVLRGEPMPIPEPTDEAGKAWYQETKAKRPWLLDSMARANQILREEGDAVLDGGMSEARRRRLTGEAKAERQTRRADRLTDDATRIAAKYGVDPGLVADTYVNPELGVTTVRLMDGRVVVADTKSQTTRPAKDPEITAHYKAMGAAASPPMKDSYFRQPDVENKFARAEKIRSKIKEPSAARGAERLSSRVGSMAEPWEYAKDLYDLNPNETMDTVAANVRKRFEDPDKAKIALDYYVARKLAMEHKAKTNSPLAAKPPEPPKPPQPPKPPKPPKLPVSPGESVYDPAFDVQNPLIKPGMQVVGFDVYGDPIYEDRFGNTTYGTAPVR
jgi:hypothetical protein